MESRNLVLAPFAVLVAVIFRFSACAGIVTLTFLLCGYAFASKFILERSSYADLTFLFPFNWNRRKFSSEVVQNGFIPTSHPVGPSSCDLCDNADCARSVSNQRCNDPPWSSVKIPQIVDNALEEFVDLTLKTYVGSWYEELVILHQDGKAEDPCFPLELKHQIRHIAASVIKRLERLDLTEWILKKVIPVAISHAEVYSRVRHHFGHNATPEVLEQRVLDYIQTSGFLHRAAYSRDAELVYLRRMSDFAALKLTDAGRLSGALANSGNWAPNPQRFVRELCVFAFLLPTLDIIADPDTINLLLILFFDPEPMKKFSDDPSPRVQPLHSFAPSSPIQVSDSLIQVKLSEIMNNPSLLYMFMNHLKSIKGPLNQLQFVMSAHLIIQRIAEYTKDASHAVDMVDSSTDETITASFPTSLNHTVDDFSSLSSYASENEGASHLHWESWELFRNYFHEGAPDLIDFPPEIFDEFKVAVEAQPEAAIPLIEKSLSAAYQEVYHWLQYEQVIPFCQSEAFLEHLSGERPEIVHKHAEDRADGNRKSARRRLNAGGQVSGGLHPSPSDAGFTMNKFRNRLTGLFKPTIEDGAFVGLSSAEGVKFSGRQGSMPNLNKAVGFEMGAPEEAEELDEDLIDFEEIRRNSQMKTAESGSLSSGGSGDEHVRDLNMWYVTIPRVEPRRDPTSGRTMYVYIVTVERNDVPEEYPLQEWSVDRRYAEFHVLESKLLEFHGDALGKLRLPPKKTFVNKGRAFIEGLRHDFEEFLQRLVTSQYLKNSELLYAFLTSPEELTSNSFQDAINPWKAMKKVPARLSREKGQNLVKFISTFAASVDMDTQGKVSRARGSPADVRSESSGFSMISIGEKGAAKEKVFGTVFKNNCGILLDDRLEQENNSNFRRSNDSSLSSVGSLFDLLLFLSAKVLRLSRWMFLLLVSLRVLLRNTVDFLVERYLRYTLKQALHERRLVELVELLRDVLYYEENKPRHELEKKARAAEALTATKGFLKAELPTLAFWALGGEGFEQDVQLLFEGLQHPRLNKQLAYVLLDLLLKEIFPELNNTIP